MIFKERRFHVLVELMVDIEIKMALPHLHVAMSDDQLRSWRLARSVHLGEVLNGLAPLFVLQPSSSPIALS